MGQVLWGVSACLLAAATACAGQPTTDGPGGATVTLAPTSASTTASSTPSATSPTPQPSQTALSWNEVFDRYDDAVVRIAVNTCAEGGGTGSGFVIGPDLVVTAAHVVDDAATISVQSPNGRTSLAKPVLVSKETDTAVVRLEDSLDVEQFTRLASSVPGRGSGLAVMGYPLGAAELSIVQGIVSRLPGPVDYPGQHVDRAFTTDAATNPGNSGGPVFDNRGEVIGLLSGGTEWTEDGTRPVEGVNFVIPVSDIATTVERASDSPGSATTVCEGAEPADPDGESIDLKNEDDSDMALLAGQILVVHGTAINQGSYDVAFDFFTPRAQRNLGGLAAWSRGVEESFWRSIVVERVVVSDEGQSALAQVRLRTEEGLDESRRTCTDWQLTYELSIGSEVLINKVRSRAPKATCAG